MNQKVKYTNNIEKIFEKTIGFNILETQEIERKRIAMDLHDSTIQSMTQLIHKSELCRELLDKDIVRANIELISMTEEIRDVINEMREIIFDLQPMTLTDLGLYATIERLVDKLKHKHKIVASLKTHGNEYEVDSIIKLSIYRMIQEACNNIIKHANATKVDIEIEFNKRKIKSEKLGERSSDKDNQIIVSIIDNGIGFNIDTAIEEAKVKGHGYGLALMKERVLLLKGNIKINSELNKGTKIEIEIPIM